MTRPFVVHVALPASLQAGIGSVITIQTSSDATTAELKALIATATGMPASSQILWFGGAQLVNTLSLRSLGLVSGDTVLLKLSSDPPPAPPSSGGVVKVTMPASLQGLFGPFVMIPAESTSTVGAIKAAVTVLTGVAASVQTLAYSGVDLTDSSTTLGVAGVPMPSGGVLDLSLGSGALPAFVVNIALPPSLQAAFGETISIASSAATTGAQFRANCAAVVGLPLAEVQLFFNGLAIADGATLGSANVMHGSTLLMVRPFLVHVALPVALQAGIGSVITIQTSSDATTAELKALIATATGMSASDQALWFGGSALVDGTTLSASGLVSGDTVC